MNMTNIRTLLLIDNDASHVDVFSDALLNATDGPFQGECVKTLAEGIRRSRGKEFWAIFLNLSLPDSQGVETFDKLAADQARYEAIIAASGFWSGKRRMLSTR